MPTKTLKFNPASVNNTNQKKQNEMLHNQAAPPVFPMQTDPNQPVPIVRQPQQSMPMNQPMGVPAMAAPPAPLQAPQIPQAPAVQQPGQFTPPPITPIAGQDTTGGLQNQLLQKGTETALKGFDTPTLDLTSQKTQELLRDPSLGADPTGQRQAQMEGFDVQQAQATEAARKSLAPVLGVGGAQGEFVNLNLANARNRSMFGADLDRKAEEKRMSDFVQALQQGRETTEQERLGFGTNVSALRDISGAAEGQEQREFQQSENAINRGFEWATNIQNQEFQEGLTELQGKIQQGLQLTEQDFTRSENELSRELQKTMQGDDIDARNAALQMQLDFDEMKMEQGFQFSEEQNALNRGLELSLQSGDQKFQEKMMGMKEKIDLNMQMTQNDWTSIESDLDRQFQAAQQAGDWKQQEKIIGMQQEFQGVQATMDRDHQTNLETMRIDQDKWQQGRIEELTQRGWDFESAENLAARENDKYMQEFEWSKKELMQQGMTEFEAEEAAKNRAWQTTESDIDRQLQREIEGGRITLEEKRLAQDAIQFDSKIDFDTWALEQGLDNEQANRIWQSGESAKDRAHDAQMQDLQQQFEMKGLDLQFIMNNIQNLPPDQAADILKQRAVEAGITYQERVTGQSVFDIVNKNRGEIGGVNDPLVNPDAFVRVAEENGIPADIAQKVLNNLRAGKSLADEYSYSAPGLRNMGDSFIKGAQTEAQIEGIRAKLDLGDQLTPEEYETFKTQGDHKPLSFSGDTMLEYTQDARGSNIGKRAWRFKDSAWNWINNNIGSTFKDPNTGELYKIQGVWEPGGQKSDKLKRGFVTLESLKDGSTVQWEGGGV